MPTLILAGGADLRTPSRTPPASPRASRAPSSSRCPFTGHSVVTSDLSDCAKNAIAAFFAGQPAAPCPAAQQVIAPTPISPTRLSKLPGRTIVTKTIAAVTATVRDVSCSSSATRSPPGARRRSAPRSAGCAPGTRTATSHGIRLRRVEFVPGVTVNGAVPAQKGASTLAISGRCGAPRQR